MLTMISNFDHFLHLSYYQESKSSKIMESFKNMVCRRFFKSELKEIKWLSVKSFI